MSFKNSPCAKYLGSVTAGNACYKVDLPNGEFDARQIEQKIKQLEKE